MEDLPLKKLRNFGGKLGEELRALGATTAGQVAAIPLKQLQHHFGDRAKWILDCVTGQYSEPVSVIPSPPPPTPPPSPCLFSIPSVAPILIDFASLLLLCLLSLLLHTYLTVSCKATYLQDSCADMTVRITRSA